MAVRNQQEKERIKARAKRLQQLRVSSRLSEQEAAAITQVSLITYKDWEYGKHPIPDRRIKFFVDTLRLDGIICELEWVSEGLGEGPRKADYEPISKVAEPAPTQYFTMMGADAEKQQIQREFETFAEGYSDAVCLIVGDDVMAPMYQSGDVVAGVKCYGKAIRKLMGKVCIVTLDNGEQLLRVLHEGHRANCYALLCLNVNSNEQSIRHDVELAYAAPVIWHRRPWR